MKVTVKDKYLNVRVGKPSINAPCYQYIAPGSELEVDGKLYKGDLYDGLDTWMKDEAGNYYWSGGVSKNLITNSAINYLDFLQNYNYQWINNKGRGVTIVVIDTGIILNQDYFDISHIKQINLADNDDKLYHGNFLCGIIAGISPVSGVANNANILSIKYKSDTHNEFPDRLNNLISALQTVNSLNPPLVINLSQGFYNNQLTNFQAEMKIIINLIESISNKKGSVIVCAASDNSDINNNVFPASLNQCISVGCINGENTNLEIKNKLDILTPLTTFSSYNNKFDVINDSGSSFSTAVISGLIASFLATNNVAKNDIINELKKLSINRSNFIYENSNTFQYNII